MLGKLRKTRMVASAGVLVAAGWGSTLALFTDTATSATGSFTTGTVSLTASDASTALTMTDMAPGDSVVAPITITNAGSLELRYAMTSAEAGDAALAAALTVDVKSGVTACTDAGFAADGTAVASGTLADIAFGDSTAGSHAGDRVLASAASEDLCFRVALPAGADTGLQGVSASATFSFAAEQTANNA